ncbi:GntR family transcriptional regulator [Clostridium formicaceticum]|uniref:GntR family transcriptional regulator n=1 Tax=Clostridium formicaceticum TaxID=1497 RepID=A0AAC9WK64_9CLOT|nr:GntR family transcriptional regulator [Clostridium formicaceticum]AOY75184.1 GntR family transcriptional regulator [Clostridium formicaceticum]ARE89610.1 putative HTH-type transcriptional regulator YdfH [Clostridium formicaceticum]
MNSLGKLKIENYKPLRELVFQHLREAILEGKLEPGRRLMEMQLAEELGVSRTPVREAIRKLELEGLVMMVPRKGAYVADVSVRDVMEVLEIRGALEGLAASLAAERMTDEQIEMLRATAQQFKEYHLEQDTQGMIEKDIEFHEIIFLATRNQKLYQVSQSLREQIYRFRVKYISEYSKSDQLVTEHDRILQAIAEREPEKAYIYGMEHIASLANHMMEQVWPAGKRKQRN